MIGADLLRYSRNQKYCVWDLETTGLNLAHALPWQCSFMICTPNQILEKHDHYVYWDKLNMSKGAATVTGFNYNDYKSKAKDPKVILDILEKYLLDDEIIVLGHHILGYDTLVHQTWRRSVGLDFDYGYLDRVIDTNALSKAFKKGIPIERSNLLAFQYKMVNFYERGLKTSLSAMAKEFGVNFDECDLHKGNKDIELNWEVWKKLVWSVEV